jgi:5-methylcytosine-specific restriction protein A
MPFAPRALCSRCRKAGCDCRKVAAKERDERRGTAAERGYVWRWRNPNKTGAADRFIANNPLCADCLKQGRVTAARDVDHIIPHKGDQELFWDETNWQSLCGDCHKRKTGHGE